MSFFRSLLGLAGRATVPDEEQAIERPVDPEPKSDDTMDIPFSDCPEYPENSQSARHQSVNNPANPSGTDPQSVNLINPTGNDPQSVNPINPTGNANGSVPPPNPFANQQWLNQLFPNQPPNQPFPFFPYPYPPPPWMRRGNRGKKKKNGTAPARPAPIPIPAFTPRPVPAETRPERSPSPKPNTSLPEVEDDSTYRAPTTRRGAAKTKADTSKVRSETTTGSRKRKAQETKGSASKRSKKPIVIPDTDEEDFSAIGDDGPPSPPTLKPSGQLVFAPGPNETEAQKLQRIVYEGYYPKRPLKPSLLKIMDQDVKDQDGKVTIKPTKSCLTYLRGSAVKLDEAEKDWGKLWNTRARFLDQVIGLSGFLPPQIPRNFCMVLAYSDAGFRSLVGNKAADLLNMFEPVWPWVHLGMDAKPGDIAANQKRINKNNGSLLKDCAFVWNRSHRSRFTWYCRHCDKVHPHYVTHPWVIKLAVGELSFEDWAGLIYRSATIRDDSPIQKKEMSHLCGNSFCINPRCLVAETKEANELRKACHASRNKCFCKQVPPCHPEKIVDAEVQKASWEQLLAARKKRLSKCPMEGCDYAVKRLPNTLLLASQKSKQHQLDYHCLELGLDRDTIKEWEEDPLLISDDEE